MTERKTAMPSWVPSQYAALYESAGKTCPEVSAVFLAAQGHAESIGFNADVVSGKLLSPKGAIGIAQFMPGTWPRWGTGNPRNPSDAIPAQAKMMCHLAKQFGSAEVALAAYNAGPNAVIKYKGSVPPYKETRGYIKRINEQMRLM